jgi:hypothetical protein
MLLSSQESNQAPKEYKQETLAALESQIFFA